MIEHDPDHPDSTERWIDDALVSLRNKVFARDAEIARLRKELDIYASGEWVEEVLKIRARHADIKGDD